MNKYQVCMEGTKGKAELVPVYIYRVSTKKTLSEIELVFCITGFEGMWPSTAELAVEGHLPSDLFSQNGNSESALFWDKM